MGLANINEYARLPYAGYLDHLIRNKGIYIIYYGQI